MSVDFTVAICTYNGAKRLPAVLDQLRNQVGADYLCWEILVVDNNSSDETAAVIYQYQESGLQRLRYCFEPQLGLATARQRAMEEAKSELVGFLDDDNVPDAHWVAAAYQFAQEHPHAGAYGSRIFGDLEVEPPYNFQRIAPFLAITNRGDKPRLYEPQQKILPPGAGLVVRKQAWLDNVPKKCFLQGRATGLKLPGEDLEALLYIQRAGWEIWYSPTMQVYHQIPSHRLERNYLIDLCRGIGLSRYHTRMLSFHQRWQWLLIFPIYVINDLRKAIMHFTKYRRVLATDVIAACEMELFWSSFLSPFYLLPVYFQNYYLRLVGKYSQPSVIPDHYKTHSPSQH
jgi:glycosyltransferase involved in cell wall biosynthesis